MQLICKYCGGTVEVKNASDKLAICKVCGGENVVLQEETPAEAIDSLRIGYHELRCSHFEDAKTEFKRVIQLAPGEPEGYFGLALAKFKVQYLYDEKHKRYSPICYSFTKKLFSKDTDFQKALELSTVEQKNLYIKKSKEIDSIHKEFLKLQKSGVEYDCFICAKVSEDDNGKRRTFDYADADKLYLLLKGKGYYPFFSERECPEHVGTEYEARILYALYTAKCMIIVCQNKQFLETPWVKNEYMRYWNMLENGHKQQDSMTFAFRGEPIQELPNGRAIQGIDNDAIDSSNLILSFVNKFVADKTVSSTKFCANCGTECLSSAKFCIECGNSTFVKTHKQYLDSKKTSSIPTDEESFDLSKVTIQDAIKQTNDDVTYKEPRINNLIKKASNGNARAQAKLGYCYQEGEGVTKNNKLGLIWLKLAADKGNNYAQYLLGIAYAKGSEDLPQDKDKAIYWYQRSAMTNNDHGIQSQFQLGLIFAEQENYAEAYNWYLMAAKRGHSGAQNNLGVLYDNGDLGEENEKLAKKWYKRAAQQGNKYGQYNFSCRCKTKFVERMLLKKSAKQGYTSSQRKLVSYYSGKGSRGRKKAQYWQKRIDNPEFNKTESHRYDAKYGYMALLFLILFLAVMFLSGFLPELIPFGINTFAGIAVTAAFDAFFAVGFLCGLCGIVDTIRTRFELGKFLTIVVSIFMIAIMSFSSFGIIQMVPGHKYSVQYFYISHNGSIEYTINDDGTLTANIVGDIDDEEFVIPNEISGKKVTAITKSSGTVKAKTVVIPDSVTSIGDYAFRYCNSLTSITIPNSVTAIGLESFEGCSSLKSITIPDSVISIDESAFSYCTSLTSITIPDSVTSIGEWAFYGCSSLTSITIPDSVTSIGDYAFAYCTNLTEVTIPRSLADTEAQLIDIFGYRYTEIVFTYTD